MLIADRFAEEQTAAGWQPSRPFDPCIMQPAVRVDKYQTITFNNDRYSFPGAYAFSPATVKGYADRVVVMADSQAVASHPQCCGHCPLVLNLLRYAG